MNSSEEREAEATRVSGVYAGYRRDARRRRAWAADNPGNVAIREELFEELRASAGRAIAGPGRILDVGCGRGYWLRRLVAHGVSPSRLSGVDILAERVDGADVPRDVDLRRADARALPFPDERFSLVMLFTVLSSLASRGDARVAIAEARRVTEPGGLIAVYEPRIPQPLNRSTLWIRRADVTDVLGSDVQIRSLTALPPLVRRLGPSATKLYPHLSAWPALRTHRLFFHERPRIAVGG